MARRHRCARPGRGVGWGEPKDRPAQLGPVAVLPARPWPQPGSAMDRRIMASAESSMSARSSTSIMHRRRTGECRSAAMRRTDRQPRGLAACATSESGRPLQRVAHRPITAVADRETAGAPGSGASRDQSAAFSAMFRANSDSITGSSVAFGVGRDDVEHVAGSHLDEEPVGLGRDHALVVDGGPGVHLATFAPQAAGHQIQRLSKGVGLRYRTVRVPVIAGFSAMTLAAPINSSKSSAMTPPWTHVGGPSYG